MLLVKSDSLVGVGMPASVRDGELGEWANGWMGERAGEREGVEWIDTTWPVVKCIAFNSTSAARAQNHTDKKTDRQTYWHIYQEFRRTN